MMIIMDIDLAREWHIHHADLFALLLITFLFLSWLVDFSISMRRLPSSNIIYPRWLRTLTVNSVEITAFSTSFHYYHIDILLAFHSKSYTCTQKRLFILSFIHLFIHSFTYSLTRSLIHLCCWLLSKDLQDNIFF